MHSHSHPSDTSSRGQLERDSSVTAQPVPFLQRAVSTVVGVVFATVLLQMGVTAPTHIFISSKFTLNNQSSSCAELHTHTTVWVSSESLDVSVVSTSVYVYRIYRRQYVRIDILVSFLSVL